jgi:4-diphosphocytidyl-2-C-methyl-D-erythritol kinase
MVGRVVLLAPAKVNLALHVTGLRADGYHLLDSIAVFADTGDQLSVSPDDELKLSVAGRFAEHAPGDRTDLAWRAAEAFFERTALKPAASIHVEKNIPAGAGLGGGSADAAAVLTALDRHSETRLPSATLREIGLKLGADVPMCLTGHALRARGIGEDIQTIEGWPPLPMVLAWPGRAVSTAEVFRSLARRDNPPLEAPPTGGTIEKLASWLAARRNDLEAPALKIAPEIGKVLAAIRATDGCLLARMSGSGSACFGLFPTLDAAEQAASSLKVKQPAWWIAATTAH